MHEPHARGADAAGAPSDPNIGRVLDRRYRIIGRIARGGMASVYEAIDERLDRTVALKIMHTGLGDAQSGDEAFAARFVREAKAAARLTHPNVVSVYDQGQDPDGTLFIAMELVPGHTLRDTITKEAPMAPERALALLEPVLGALAAAHRAGVIHRDVKPENVLIADDGRIKVADFGLAKAVSADTQHTATQGVLIGTVSYLAPELVVDGIADPRADVYAIGVILFELLTGTKPHTGETPIQVAYRHVHNDVPAPSSLVRGLPPYVDALVARATTRDRTLRPADAGVLLHHVRRVQAALRDGLADDSDLVTDLTPPQSRPEAESAARVSGDTVPEPVEELWDEAEAEALFGPPDPDSSAPPPAPPPAPSGHTQVISEPPIAESSSAGPSRRRGRGPLLLLALVLVIALIASGAYWFAWARYTTTPNVVRLSDAKAIAALDKADLEVAHDDAVHSETIAKGSVVSTDPASGERILPGRTVTITLSLGPELHDVPDVAGSTVEEATAELAEVKLVVGRVIERYSETVTPGQVIRTDPPYGSKKAKQLRIDSAVRLIVSLGPKPIKVKDWTGKDADRATAFWERKGLKVEVSGEEYSETVAKGAIISQDPSDGTLFKKQTVKIVVSKGPPLVEIPGVFYEVTEDAVAQLEDLGLKVKIKHAAIYFNGNRAYSTDPPAGTKVPKGSTVTIYVV